MTAAAHRLARSRAALVAAMSANEAVDAARRAQSPGDHAVAIDEGLLARLRRTWQAHPAHLAVEVAGPLLSRWSARHPDRLLALAALAGAGIVLVRPWRWLPAGALGALAWRAGLRGLLQGLGLPGLLLPLLLPLVLRLRRPAPHGVTRQAGPT